MEKKAIPVYEAVYNHFDRYEEETEESDEEVLLDGERDEDDWGCDFVVNDKNITYTRVKAPKKIYYRRDEDSVLHDDEEFPIPTISKLALDRYNSIEGTEYDYVGLVKAYKIAVQGFNYTIRFKACLPDQHPVYFQAIVYQRMPDRITRVAVLDVSFVYPLPSPVSA